MAIGEVMARLKSTEIGLGHIWSFAFGRRTNGCSSIASIGIIGTPSSLWTAEAGVAEPAPAASTAAPVPAAAPAAASALPPAAARLLPAALAPLAGAAGLIPASPGRVKLFIVGVPTWVASTDVADAADDVSALGKAVAALAAAAPAAEAAASSSLEACKRRDASEAPGANPGIACMGIDSDLEGPGGAGAAGGCNAC
ncbi:uncharacterized protein EMH_0099300 [Eimeria mitis]|uniref:Uncharacterized protein n=1 Tax=Eimeria mitis TaxID=44415 RepID=U6KH99_9EIME|nr:uncharacterized protein EMH_0099300 [Eimeria mitis]CDJ35652.1 hypothetical protein EMH_0099300 [Eimeria mitis]